MQVFYNGQEIQSNSYLNKQKAQEEPKIKIGENVPESSTLIMYDPKAVGGTYLHWIVQDYFSSSEKKKIILPYQGPAPPKGTGVHDYIFSLFDNITFPSLPMERKINNINEITSGKEPIVTFTFHSSTPDGGKRRRKKKTKTCKKKGTKIKRKKTRRHCMGYRRHR
jgi:phosphatidylethanolamine-binding protein (PEBP) family uncharacterized protein